MYFPDHSHVLPGQKTLHWTIRGRPGRNANLSLTLELIFYHTQSGHEGLIFIVDEWPQEVGIVPLKVKPVGVIDKTQAPIHLLFEEDVYELFTVEEFLPGGGRVYFHAYPPAEYGGGDIVYSDTDRLESSRG